MNQFRSNRKSFHSLDAVDTSYFETGGKGGKGGKTDEEERL